MLWVHLLKTVSLHLLTLPILMSGNWLLLQFLVMLRLWVLVAVMLR